MSKSLELIPGTRFGNLTVLHAAGHNKHGHSLFAFSCDCGGEVINLGTAVKSGHATTCGHACPLYRRGLHLTGLTSPSRHPIYDAWSSMHVRCYCKTRKNYSDYGGRGIKVCEAWHDFVEFFADMAPGWESGKSLDRKNNDGDYSPQNCRWATTGEQCNNRRSCRWLDTPEGPMTLANAARHYSINLATLWSRLKRGKSVEEALKL